MRASEAKVYPARKRCTHCGKKRVITKFRLLASGYRQSMCQDCERRLDRERWHSRSPRARAA